MIAGFCSGAAYPAIGPYKASGFIIGTPAGPRSLCRGVVRDWHADHTLLVKVTIDNPQLAAGVWVRVAGIRRKYIIVDSTVASLPPTVPPTGTHAPHRACS